MLALTGLVGVKDEAVREIARNIHARRARRCGCDAAGIRVRWRISQVVHDAHGVGHGRDWQRRRRKGTIFLIGKLLNSQVLRLGAGRGRRRIRSTEIVAHDQLC